MVPLWYPYGIRINSYTIRREKYEKNQILKKLPVFLLTTLFIFSATVTNTNAAYFSSTPLRGQERDYWCWSASGQMLLETQKNYKSQNQIANGLLDYASFPTLKSKLKAVAPALNFDYYTRSFSFQEVKNGINGNWAIAGGFLPRSSSKGHMMVITGYDSGAGWNNVWLQDPWGPYSSRSGGLEGWVNYNTIRGDAGYDFNGSKFGYLAGR